MQSAPVKRQRQYCYTVCKCGLRSSDTSTPARSPTSCVCYRWLELRTILHVNGATSTGSSLLAKWSSLCSVKHLDSFSLPPPCALSITVSPSLFQMRQSAGARTCSAAWQMPVQTTLARCQLPLLENRWSSGSPMHQRTTWVWTTSSALHRCVSASALRQGGLCCPAWEPHQYHCTCPIPALLAHSNTRPHACFSMPVPRYPHPGLCPAGVRFPGG